MNKALKALHAIALILKKPALLNQVLEDEQFWRYKVDKVYGKGKVLPVVALDTLFGQVKETISPYASLDGSSLPTDLALLKLFARSITDCSYFEIGTWRGESVANVAAVAENCFTLNLPASQMRKMGMDEKYIRLHRFFSDELANVTHLEGDSRTFDYASLRKKFDLVFIDGDHHYEFVKNDTEKIFKHLVHENSVVVWHDYAFHPERIRFEVMAGILAGCPNEFHSRIYHVANTMCAVYLNKDLPAAEFVSPQSPSSYFELNISQNRS